MQVDDALVEKLANLSKLEFDEPGKAAIKKDLTRILSFMEKLNELDTEGVEPLIHVNEDVNVFREDVVIQPITKAEALQNAPLKDADHIKVPKFVKAK
jgi:aspartyl-tRNA(Asn)/glutamyl-tRNA(Gln) amidotransferase subunit C